MQKLLTSIVTTASLITFLLAISSNAAYAGINLSQSCEEALALSALPERLRNSASVYVLGDNGFKKTIERAGEFTCIVERNHADAMAPQCMDSTGAPVIIPAIMFKTEQALSGVGSEQRAEAFSVKAVSGEFKPPAGPGISYMMSDYNYIHINDAAGVRKVHPHVMFYAPNMDNDDIGGSFADASSNPGQPFIIDPGIHGYMVTFVEQSASSDAVIAECEGQLPSR